MNESGLRRHGATIAFGLYVVAVAVFRFVVLTDQPAPATIDAGNWLAFGNALFGEEEVRVGSIVYPPVIPLLMVGLTRWWGPIAAVGVLGAVSSIMPACGAYVVLRSFGLRWVAALLAALLAPAAATGEATAWGGFPQLLGAGGCALFLVVFDRTLRRPEWATTFLSAAAAGLVLATSHFAATFTAIAAVILVAIHLVATSRGERRPWVVERLGHLAVVAVPAVASIPMYAPLLTAVRTNLPEETDVAALGWANLVESVEFTYRDVPVLWRALILAGLGAPIVLRDRWRTSPWMLSVAVLAAVIVASVLSREARYLYFLPFGAVLAMGLWAVEMKQWRSDEPDWIPRLATVGLVLVLVAQTIGGLQYFPDQRDYYGIITPGLYDAMQWIDDELPADTTVGVTTVDDAPLGWWIEGEVQRRTIYASPLRWLSFADEIDRARVANQIFAPPFPADESLALAARSDVDVLLVAIDSSRYEPEEMDAFLDDHPDLVLYRNDGAVVLDVPDVS